MTNDRTTFMDYVDRLARDPLHAAREAAQRGQRVVAYIGDIPVEMILAANAFPVRLVGVTEQTTPQADKYLESAFLPETRAVAQQWISGALDFIDAVVFPRSDDSAQRLYYYLCELQRTERSKGPIPILYDTATSPRATSRAHTLDSTHRLAAALRTDVFALPAAIQRVKERALLCKELNTRRQQMPALSGSEIYRVLRAATLDWSSNFDLRIRSWLTIASPRQYSRRILLVGSAPPDERIHAAVESGDALVVREFIGERDLLVEVHGDDALNIIAERQHQSASLGRQLSAQPHRVTNLARNLRVDGVILWAIEEDEVLPWEIPRQIAALDAAKIPLLALVRQRWRADQPTLDYVARFARTLDPKP